LRDRAGVERVFDTLEFVVAFTRFFTGAFLRATGLAFLTVFLLLVEVAVAFLVLTFFFFAVVPLAGKTASARRIEIRREIRRILSNPSSFREIQLFRQALI